MSATATFGDTVWDLPPLILYPCNERLPPSALADHSRAALILAGLIPSDGSDEEALGQKLLAGRCSEIRMLFFLGKDLCRWIEQCVDWARRVPAMAPLGIRPQSFARLVTADPPEGVRQKLERWGVADHVSIFSRAIGLNVIFAQPPATEGLSETFLRGYHRYADLLYHCYLESQPHQVLEPRNFRFELYASGEYSRLLESQWEP